MKRFPFLKKLFTWRRLRLVLLLAALLLAAFTLYLDFRVRDAFEGRRFALPARLYARPLELFPGRKLTPEALVSELNRLDYRSPLAGNEAARYERDGGRIVLVTRAFRFGDGEQPARTLEVSFGDGQVHALRDRTADAEVTLVRLDPPYIGGIYPGHNEDRLLVRLDQVPAHVIDALVAIEDRKFYRHHGIDPRGIARALVALASGRGVQGGSTLTQQLVKNFFLTPERTLSRKATEILMALLLELHYDKREILETYFNEIYLAQDGNRAIHGIGLASQFFFGKPVEQLSVAEGALLVGMVKGPILYDPRKHPQRARERRDLVLTEMSRLAMLDAAQLDAARASPLGVIERPVTGTTRYPAFLDLVRRQLKSDYREDDLRSEGLHILTTLDPEAQESAERALAQGLARIERSRRNTTALEGAVVVTAVQTGEVQALVGGRDPRFEGFNRALDARRPAGSLLKPVIYLTALANPEKYTLITPIDDSPLVWKERGIEDWKPENYDHKNHGQVPLRLALAIPTTSPVPVSGSSLGLTEVLDNVRRLGIERELPPYAASLLGAVDLAPIEIAGAYQTIASGGFRMPLRAIREVLTPEGQPISRYGLSVDQVFAPAPVYLTTNALQGVVREGTGTGLRHYLPESLALAGKTGTTDELRDAWFAGYSGDRVAVVWVGRDDNTPTGLSGSSGALPIWGELMRQLDPEPLALPMPDDIELVWIDPPTGLRADRDCPGAIELPFARDSAPEESAPCARVPRARRSRAGSAGCSIRTRQLAIRYWRLANNTSHRGDAGAQENHRISVVLFSAPLR
ncbi:MAG: penicillin-binding protein 1B [Desulfosudis oleivorans]|nr:penicillin-binding protein 1B [Desulfosudis oleivorans]